MTWPYTMPEFDFDPERDIPELTGKGILLTGGTAGLGALAIGHFVTRNPARIYFTGRQEKAAEDIRREVRDSGSNTEIEFLPCDLISLEAVKQTADTLLARESRLDVLVANAGVMAKPVGLTKHGYELQFGTNHMGHALLIRKLLPLLEKTASRAGADVRIVILSSLAFVLAPRPSGIMFDELKTTQVKKILVATPFFLLFPKKLRENSEHRSIPLRLFRRGAGYC